MASSSTVGSGSVRCVSVDISLRYIGREYTRDRRARWTPGGRTACRSVPGPAPSTGSGPVRPWYTGAVRRHTDYTLARRAVLRDLQRGAVARLDVCDAHPELLRAARHVGEPAPHDCPVCRRAHVALRVLRLRRGPAPGQRALHLHPSELERLGAAHDEFARYVVEVCPDCRWNHLTRRELHGRRHGGAPAPTPSGTAGRRARLSGRARRRRSGRATALVFRLPPGAVRALDGGGTRDGRLGSRSRRALERARRRRAQGLRRAAGDGHGVRRAVGARGRRRGCRHDPRRRLGRDGRARLRRHAARHRSTTWRTTPRRSRARSRARSSSPTCRG